MKVLVIGAGVIGLTTAITLRDAGHTVVIWADTAPGDSTSSKAAAIWEPFQPQIASGQPSPEALAYQRDVLAWGALAYDGFLASLDAASGVKRARVLELKRNDQPPWWAAGEMGARLRLTRARTPAALRAIGPYAEFCYTFDSLVIDMSRYLTYLEARFTAGQPERLVIPRHVGDMTAITGYDAVVNCAGLGARDLTGQDGALRARRGQIARLRRVDFPAIMVDGEPVSALLDGDQEAIDAGELTYLVPRFDDIVLGGTYEPLDLAAERAHQGMVARGAADAWSVAVRQGILSRNARLLAALDAGDAALTQALRRYATLDAPPGDLRDDGGLRPFRDPIRVERGADLPGGARLVHNYGHGGAGVTLCWGCARRVAELL